MRLIRSCLPFVCLLVAHLCVTDRAAAQARPAEQGEYGSDLEKAAYDLSRGKRERARSVYEEILSMVEEGEDDEIPLGAEQARAWLGLARIQAQTGEYAKAFILEGATNYPSMTAYRRLNAAHPIEQTGEKLRAMMPWIKKIVDKSKN